MSSLFEKSPGFRGNTWTCTCCKHKTIFIITMPCKRVSRKLKSMKAQTITVTPSMLILHLPSDSGHVVILTGTLWPASRPSCILIVMDVAL